jgi:chorismate mutase/prephenate dehydratase
MPESSEFAIRVPRAPMPTSGEHRIRRLPPTLTLLRGAINRIDDDICQKLEARASLMNDVALAKQAAGIVDLRDEKREEQLIARVVRRVDRFPARAVAAIFREIMSACLSLQYDPKRTDGRSSSTCFDAGRS